MHRALGSLLGISGILVAGATLAGNPVYHCDAGTVVRDARVIAYPSDDVSMFSDPENQVCTFTVNGATETGPSQPTGQVLRDEIISRLEKGEVASLVTRLTAARPPDRASDARAILEKTLSTATDELTRCFQSLADFGAAEQAAPQFAEAGFQYYLAISEPFQVRCSVTPPGTFHDHTADMPVLLLRSESSSGIDSLFVPQGAVR